MTSKNLLLIFSFTLNWLMLTPAESSANLPSATEATTNPPLVEPKESTTPAPEGNSTATVDKPSNSATTPSIKNATGPTAAASTSTQIPLDNIVFRPTSATEI